MEAVEVKVCRSVVNVDQAVKSKMNHPSPSPGVEHNAMSVSSELRPLYRLTSVKEECTEEELNSLSNLAKQVFSFQSKTNSAHIGQECPINCPCKCHLPSPIPAVVEYRPSVIMAPVAREQRGSSVTHFPLRMQTKSLDKLSSESPHRKTVNEVIVEKRKKTTSATSSVGDTVLNDYDEEEHFIRVNTDGKTAKFKLTKKDWELMEIKEYPSGGRLLGGAWTTIFRRGVKQSNEWCNLRLTNNQVRAENSRRMHSSPFFRGAGECKFPGCNAKVKFVIHKERGKYVHVTYVGNVYHKVRGSSVAKK